MKGRYDTVKIYINGACGQSTSPGGWAAVLVIGRRQKVLCGGDRETSSNKMVLTAAIRALEHIAKRRSRRKVIIISDNTYLQAGITTWVHRWRSSNWKTIGNKAVNNAELWAKLDKLAQPLNVTWQWTHQSNEYKNNLA